MPQACTVPVDFLSSRYFPRSPRSKPHIYHRLQSRACAPVPGHRTVPHRESAFLLSHLSPNNIPPNPIADPRPLAQIKDQLPPPSFARVSFLSSSSLPHHLRGEPWFTLKVPFSVWCVQDKTTLLPSIHFVLSVWNSAFPSVNTTRPCLSATVY